MIKRALQKWLGINKARGTFEAAKISRYIDFYTRLEAAHHERMRDLAALRAHSRDLAKNNAYMKSFIELVSCQVIGPSGVLLENGIQGDDGGENEACNDAVEAAWNDWGQCVTADGRLSWPDFQHLAIESLAVDGEIFIHLMKGRGKYGLELALIDPDRVDHSMNTALAAGRRVIMGVEVDDCYRPLAYHIKTSHPNDMQGRPQNLRVPADQILHVYLDERSQSVRGIPWATPCMVQLNMLSRLWTATLAAANAEADRLGIIKGASGLPLDELNELSEKSAATSVADEISSEMATFIGLPPGLDVDFPPLNHPSPILADFTKFLLKGVASGLQVSYHSLAGDVAEANYSSLRAALLLERDAWQKRQNSTIRKMHTPINRVWAEMAWLSGKIPLRMAPEEFCRPIWWPRAWDWVDPKKDIEASAIAIEKNLSTYQEEIGFRGQDWRHVFRQKKLEQDFAAQIGLQLKPDVLKPTGGMNAKTNQIA
jgi:lambda family phage portal protein